ncbi:hypothetical protein A33Q_0890 [Indibacter alkaliphilus LW1]|uniref:Uncharacterized protein n=1 Tax=Indibacter alkaliphilus (strain CCUG 57479 / KCTC 22604 / LW1) TaxID=1189612 RepID=S2DIU1_INDAL|nr:hypothetical protein A33Q_0890 [Indibacter alkaliphilus LW1]
MFEIEFCRRGIDCTKYKVPSTMTLLDTRIERQEESIKQAFDLLLGE